MVTMAKRRTSKQRPVRTSRRRVYTRARTGIRAAGGKIKWGEAILAAIVGYEGDKIVSPVAGPIFDAIPNGTPAGNIVNAMANSQGGAFSKAVNKTLGTVAMAKVAYDAVKHRSLDSNDLSLYIPYAIGTVFDAPGGSSSGTGVW